MEKKLRFNNTYKSGSLSYLVSKKGSEYVGVCLELDLIVYEDSLSEAKERIVELSQAWINNIIANKLPEELLNKPAPQEYWNLLKKVLTQMQIKAKLERSNQNVLSPQKSTIFGPLPYSGNQSFNFA